MLPTYMRVEMFERNVFYEINENKVKLLTAKC